MSYHVIVSSETPFATFEYDFLTYRYIASRIKPGIITLPDGVRVTDTERTIIDGINDFEKVMGLEELLRCIELLPLVNEERLLSYLAVYRKQVLYQKVGYILEHFRDSWNLSGGFFTSCETHIGKSKRYLYNSPIRDNMVLNSRWRLVVPRDISRITSKGVHYNADI